MALNPTSNSSSIFASNMPPLHNTSDSSSNYDSSMFSSDIIEPFVDELTEELREDAVIDHHGHTFERKFIVEWLQTKKTCPYAPDEPLTLDQLVPNRALQHAQKHYLHKENGVIVNMQRQIELNERQNQKFKEDMFILFNTAMEIQKENSDKRHEQNVAELNERHNKHIEYINKMNEEKIKKYQEALINLSKEYEEKRLNLTNEHEQIRTEIVREYEERISKLNKEISDLKAKSKQGGPRGLCELIAWVHKKMLICH